MCQSSRILLRQAKEKLLRLDQAIVAVLRTQQQHIRMKLLEMEGS